MTALFKIVIIFNNDRLSLIYDKWKILVQLGEKFSPSLGEAEPGY